MSIVLKLNNNNTADCVVEVFRATTPLLEESLPEPIAILSGDVRFYEEKDFLFHGVDYYYRVRVTPPNGETVLYPQTIHRLGLDVGPGPTELIYGDENFGLFGLFAAYDWEPELSEIFKNFRSVDNMNTRMVKYIRKGVVYYTCNALTPLVPKTLWDKNAIASKNSNPFTENEEVRQKFLQDNEFTQGNYRFAVRLPQLVDDNKEFTNFNSDFYNPRSTTTPVKSEGMDLMRAAIETVQVSKKFVPFKFIASTGASSKIAFADGAPGASVQRLMYVDVPATGVPTFNTSNGYTQTGAVTTMLLAEYRGLSIPKV